MSKLARIIRAGYPANREFWVVVIVALLALMTIGINEWSYHSSLKSRKMLVENTATRAQISSLIQRLTDAEVAQRGYFLTGQNAYLAPYKMVASDTSATLKFLKQQYQTSAVQSEIVDSIARSSTSMLAVLERLLSMRESSRYNVELERMLHGLAKAAMDDIRSNAEKLSESEMIELLNERIHVQKTMDLTRMGVNALTLFGALGCAFFMMHIAKFNAERRRHAGALEAQRDSLEIEVQRRTEVLRELTRYLQTAREDERARVARELHDELGALLTAAKFDTARLKRSLPSSEREAQERIDHLNATISEGIALKRRIIEDLHPSALRNLGLLAALEIQVREFELRTSVKIISDLDPRVSGLPDDVELTIYRIVQEAFTNTAKYAGASEIQLGMHVLGSEVRVSVSDNGCGFDVANLPNRSHGLTGMRYRVEAHGGRIKLTSALGRGTQIEAWLPAAMAKAA